MHVPQVFSTQELLDRGIGPEAIRRQVRTGQLARLRQGQYCFVDDPESIPESDISPPLEHRSGPGRYTQGDEELAHLKSVVAASRDIGSETWFCRFSAGVLHELPMPAGAVGVVHLLRVGSGAGRRTRTAVHHRARLPERDRATIDGIRCTGIERTAVDLARTLPFRDGLAVIDAVLARGIAKSALFSRLTRHPGNLQARRLIELGDRKSDSPGESRCRATMALAGVPVPVCQFSVRLASGREVFPDFGWPDLRLVGEYDGVGKYGTLLKPGQDAVEVIRNQRLREAQVREVGWWMVRWMGPDLLDLNRFRKIFLDAERAATHLRAA